MVWIELKENPAALRNPMKGWRGQIALHYGWGSKPIDDLGTQPIGTPYESLRKWYVSWDTVETKASDGTDLLRKEADRVLADFPDKNMKAIVRLALYSKRGSELPEGLPPLNNPRACDWYLRPEVKARIERLIEKAAEAWDQDPRVAYIEMGVVSKYGEQWDLGMYPKVEAYLHEAFKAFENKPVLIRGCGIYPWSPSAELASSREYGFFQDSFGKPWYEKELLTMARFGGGDRWHRVPIGGESKIAEHAAKADQRMLSQGRSDFIRPHKREGRVLVPGLLEDASRLDYFHDLIYQSHTSFLGSPFGTELTGGPAESITSIQKALGYRFVLRRAAFTTSTAPGGKLKVKFELTNNGSAPIYGKWPIEVSLVEPKTRRVVWNKAFAEVNASGFLPGDRYDPDLNRYTLKPKVYRVSEAFTLPGDIPPGEYAVALSIVDAEGGGRPAVRFANQHYWRGGLHPLGITGVGQATKTTLDPGGFFTGSIDPSLQYQVPQTTD